MTTKFIDYTIHFAVLDEEVVKEYAETIVEGAYDEDGDPEEQLCDAIHSIATCVDIDDHPHEQGDEATKRGYFIVTQSIGLADRLDDPEVQDQLKGL